MKIFLIAALASTAASGAILLTQSPHLQPAGRASAPMHHGAPVLVELFQSQGCSSCPPATANVNEIADRPDVVALSFAVTYWDDLGWKDTFASPQFTQRQWDYARFNGRGNVATPQVWLNGHTALVGSNSRELAADIASESSGGPSVAIHGATVTIGAGSAPRAADVWLAHYDPHVLEVPIRAGENGGRTLPHKNIVRELVRVGRWSGSPETIALPPTPRGLATAVFLQAGKGGPVLSAAKAV